MAAFCGRILALGRGDLQMSWCKCPGVPRGHPPPPGLPLISALLLKRSLNARGLKPGNFVSNKRITAY